MRVNSRSCGNVIFVSGPMISCTSPRAEIAAGAIEDDGADAFLFLQIPEKVAQLGIGLEREGILALGAAGAVITPTFAFDAPLKVRRGSFMRSPSAWLFTLARSLSGSPARAPKAPRKALPPSAHGRAPAREALLPERVAGCGTRDDVGFIQALDEPLLLELIDDGGDVAAGHHEQARKLVHLEPLAVALELRPSGRSAAAWCWNSSRKPERTRRSMS